MINRSRLLGAGLALVAVGYVYSSLVAVHGPSSQAASLAVVVDGIAPTDDAGLRADVFVEADPDATGCPDVVPVKIVISGTPGFWKRYAYELRGTHRIGIGFRTSYRNARLLDWSGYDLPDAVGNLVYPSFSERVPNPRTSGRIRIAPGQDDQTGARWFVVEVDDWADHWTPLVLEVDAAWTSRRSLGSCHVVLPELMELDDTTVGDARAASSGAGSVLDEAPDGSASAFGADRPVNALTVGRVVLRSDGQVLDGESRPAPQIVDRNPWTTRLGEIGDQAAVWTCTPPPGREEYPLADATNAVSREVAPDPQRAAWVGCGGIAAVQSWSAGTLRDLSLLTVGGLFSTALGALTTDLVAVARRRLGGVLRRSTHQPPVATGPADGQTGPDATPGGAGTADGAGGGTP